MDRNDDLTESVRAAVLSQFARGDLKLPIPLESIRPEADPESGKSRFWRWFSEGRKARTEAALLAQHGKFLVAYTQELHKEVVPANGTAVREICTAALDVVHNQQLRRRAASAFQAVLGVLTDYATARSEIEAIRAEIGDEAVNAALEAAELRFRQCLGDIQPNGSERQRLRPRTIGEGASS